MGQANQRASDRRRKPWQKPRLERLGKISDIAGPPVPFMQAVNNKFS